VRFIAAGCAMSLARHRFLIGARLILLLQNESNEVDGLEAQMTGSSLNASHSFFALESAYERLCRFGNHLVCKKHAQVIDYMDFGIAE
jgi:hypothetical protein